MTRVVLFPGALDRVAESEEAKAACRRAGEEVAESVRSLGIDVWDLEPGTAYIIPLPVRVDDDANVILAHPAGIAVQAKHGALTKGASAVGLRVKG